MNTALKCTKNIRLYKRYSALLKHFECFTNRKIAEMENIEEHTVLIYIKNYKAKKLDGLNIAHSDVASRKINDEQKKSNSRNYYYKNTRRCWC